MGNYIFNLSTFRMFLSFIFDMLLPLNVMLRIKVPVTFWWSRHVLNLCRTSAFAHKLVTVLNFKKKLSLWRGSLISVVVKKLHGGWASGEDEVCPDFKTPLVLWLSWSTRLCSITWTLGAVPLDWLPCLRCDRGSKGAGECWPVNIHISDLGRTMWVLSLPWNAEPAVGLY